MVSFTLSLSLHPSPSPSLSLSLSLSPPIPLPLSQVHLENGPPLSLVSNSTVRSLVIQATVSPTSFLLCRVNNCVGWSNYKFFFLFLFYTVLLCVWVAVTGAYDFARAWVSCRIDPYSHSYCVSLVVCCVCSLVLRRTISRTSSKSYSVLLCALSLACPLLCFCSSTRICVSSTRRPLVCQPL